MKWQQQQRQLFVQRQPWQWLTAAATITTSKIKLTTHQATTRNDKNERTAERVKKRVWRRGRRWVAAFARRTLCMVGRQQQEIQTKEKRMNKCEGVNENKSDGKRKNVLFTSRKKKTTRRFKQTTNGLGKERESNH